MSVAVVGGGAWGTALAAVAARGGPVSLLLRDPAKAEAINTRRENPAYLPGIALPEGIDATLDPVHALDGADIVLLVTPAQTLRTVCRTLAAAAPPRHAALVLCSKGIERDTGLFASAVVAAELPGHPVAVLSGPSFATDVAAGLPTAVTLAARDAALADDLARRLSGPAFRIYAGTDVLGVEAGGALKNVLAIAAGAAAGLGLGASAQAALVTRGFVELSRLGQSLGADPRTLMGLSGLGDLVLTCSGTQSRNFAYGLALGKGEDLSRLKLAEGVYSAGIAARLAHERGIEAPIIEAVAGILDGALPVEGAVSALLARPLKREFETA